MEIYLNNLLTQLESSFLNPAFYLLVLPAVFLLERFYGVAVDGGKLGRNFRSVDILWFLASPVLQFAFVLFPSGLLHEVYAGLNFPRYEPRSAVSLWIAYPASLLLLDFLLWLSHWIRHTVTPFWFFHRLHHGIKDLGFFGSYRLHPFDLLVYGTLLSLPIYFFHSLVNPILPFLIFVQWYTALTHSPMKTDFGMLQYLLVTPNSHRVHHAREHAKFNYGFVFSFWDRLFRTYRITAVGREELGS